MVKLESNIYNKSNDGDIILGATIILYNSENNEIERISVVDESELTALKNQLNVLDETYIKFNNSSSLAGRSIDNLLSNTNQDVVINATRLSGLSSADFSRVGHTHDDRYYTEAEMNTKLNAKANSSHNHSTWNYIKVNDYCWMWVNTQLRLVDFNYYRTDYNFKTTNEITFHSGKNYSNSLKAYSPAHSVKLAAYNPGISGMVNVDGDILFRSDTVATRSINASAMWHY